MTLLLKRGLQGLKKVETYGVLAIIAIIFWLFFSFSSHVSFENLLVTHPKKFTFPLGVILFALLGFQAIPEVRKEIVGQEKKLKRAVIIGTLIPVFLYILFVATFVGVLGIGVPEIATLSLSNIVTVLGIFTMLTSYLVLSFALQNTFIEDLYLSKKTTFFLTSVIPLVVYVIISVTGFLDFVSILSIAGIISGGFSGILIMFMNINAKKKHNRKSEISMPISWFIIVVLSVIFITATILQFTN